MSDDEVLRFEITDQDLDNEFNFDLRRPRMSKNQATYGIWAGDSDDDGDPDARPSFSSGGTGRRGGGGKSNAPVNFVSAGIQQVRLDIIHDSSNFFVADRVWFCRVARKRKRKRKRPIQDPRSRAAKTKKKRWVSQPETAVAKRQHLVTLELCG